MKYVYALISAIAASVITFLAVTGSPPKTSVWGVLEILVVSVLVFAGTVAFMTRFGKQSL